MSQIETSQHSTSDAGAEIQSVASAVLSCASGNDTSEGYIAVVQRGVPYLVSRRHEIADGSTSADLAYIDHAIAVGTDFLAQHGNTE